MILRGRKIARAFLFAPLAFLLAGSCVSGAEGQGEIQVRLDENRDKWSSRSIASYRFEFRWICYCVPDYRRPVVISVGDGEIDSVEYADTGQKLEPSEFDRYRTVAGLFKFLQEAIDRRAHRITVSYDAELGYPRSAEIDYHEQMMDEEMKFAVDKFEAIK